MKGKQETNVKEDLAKEKDGEHASRWKQRRRRKGSLMRRQRKQRKKNKKKEKRDRTDHKGYKKGRKISGKRRQESCASAHDGAAQHDHSKP